MSASLEDFRGCRCGEATRCIALILLRFVRIFIVFLVSLMYSSRSGPQHL